MIDTYDLSDSPPKVLHFSVDVTPEVIELAVDCAESAYGLGNDFRIDWERAYQMLEMYGYEMQEMDSPADRKIRRLVNKIRREAGQGVGSIED